jgi:amphiphysin
MCSYFPVINDTIAKRNKKAGFMCEILVTHPELLFCQLLDYDAARSRMKKLIEKPSDDPNKLPKVGSRRLW